MLHTIKYSLIAFVAILAFTACAPEESDDYSLGKMDSITADKISFTQTVSPTTNNIITFTNTTTLSNPYSLSWDLGNGVTSKSQSVTGTYALAGSYTVTLSISTADGVTASKSQTIVIAKDDPSLLDTPTYRNLTGGPSNPDGKTWVFDQYNLFTAEVAKATGKDIRGHIGLGEPGSYSQGWWGASPEEKASWQMYSSKFKFTQSGFSLNITNTGKGYGRSALAAAGGFTGVVPDAGDAEFNYNGGNYTFALTESGTYPTLKLSGNAFMGYYCGTQEYEIMYLTDKVMTLRALNTVEGQDWVYIFIREDLNVAVPAIVKTPKTIPLADNFEGTPKVNFTFEDMGNRTAPMYSNPAPVPINESAHVFAYEKSSEFYSNISFTTTDYLFDLTSQNKVYMKVFIPGYNNYTTEGAVAGDWITNKKLLKKVVVKLQDSSKGGNAWETQTEVAFNNLETDKWINLVFDFSNVSNRKDYDKIVIQFGDEGHSRPGVFFFDDFAFDK